MTTNPQKPNSSDAVLAALRYADSRVLVDIMSADIGEPNPAAPQYPAWVVKCGQKVARATYPRAYAVNDDGLTMAYKAGLAIGMMVGSESKLADTFKELGLKIDREPTQQELAAAKNFLFGENSGLTFPKDGSSLIPDEVKEDMARWEAEMTIEQKGNFHAGISDAFSMLAGRNQTTPATARYTTMLVYWKVVEALKTMEQLHDFLTRVHGQNIVGSDIKITRQLCQRVGKRFKPPGRPKLPQA